MQADARRAGAAFDRRMVMAEQRPRPTDQEVRTYMHKLKGFRDSLSPREQRMLDAVVLASYWPDESSADTHGYRHLTPPTLYDEDAATPPFDTTPWAKALDNY
jgi:hypothetical protein